jgi:hypothetical protein
MNGSGFQMIESILSSHIPEAEAAIIAFAGHLATYKLNSGNAHIYQKILAYNNPAAVDALLKYNNPGSFFSVLESSRSLASFASSTLSDYRTDELYEPVVLVCLGILYNTYKNPEYGMTIYPLTVSDIYHSAKYLKSKNEEIESVILSFLDSLNGLSGRSDISNLAGNITDTHFDNNKKLENIIPAFILS